MLFIIHSYLYFYYRLPYTVLVSASDAETHSSWYRETSSLSVNTILSLPLLQLWSRKKIRIYLQQFRSFLILSIIDIWIIGAVSVISGLALFIGKVWVMTIAGIGGYYYMQGQYDDKVRERCSHHYLMMVYSSMRWDAALPKLVQLPH